MSYGMAEAFFTAEELVVAEAAHRGVGVAEGVHLAEEVRKAGGIRLTNLLESVLVKSYGGERLARVLDGREGCERASGLGEPSDEFDAVEPEGPRGLVPVREPLSDEDGGTGAEHAADLASGENKVWNVVKHEGEPRGVCRFIRQRQGARSSLKHLDRRYPRDLIPHRGRRLDREDAEVEPIAESGGEHTCPRADVDQSHSFRRAQVASHRLAPLRESVPWDLPDRLERRSGLLVVADPGHVVPPCRQRLVLAAIAVMLYRMEEAIVKGCLAKCGVRLPAPDPRRRDDGLRGEAARCEYLGRIRAARRAAQRCFRRLLVHVVPHHACREDVHRRGQSRTTKAVGRGGPRTRCAGVRR